MPSLQPVFFQEKHHDVHIERVLAMREKATTRVDASSPELSSTVDIHMLSTYDIKDRLQRQWLSMKQGDKYDGI